MMVKYIHQGIRFYLMFLLALALSACTCFATGLLESEAAEPFSALSSRKGPETQPRLLCFMVVTPGTTEVDLVKNQVRNSIGATQCDELIVISNQTLDFGVGPDGSHVAALTIQEPRLYAPLAGVFHRALNTEAFAKAWQLLFSVARVKAFDFIVKLDPDTVLWPQRLKTVLREYYGNTPVGASFLNNCQKGFRGALEVLSREGFELFEARLDECGEARHNADDLDTGFSEDAFLRSCWPSIGIRQDDVYAGVRMNELMVETCVTDRRIANIIVESCLSNYAAFHPFKDVQRWQGCWERGSRLKRQQVDWQDVFAARRDVIHVPNEKLPNKTNSSDAPPRSEDSA